MDLLADLMEMEGGVPDLGTLNGLPADVLHVIQGHLQDHAGPQQLLVGAPSESEGEETDYDVPEPPPDAAAAARTRPLQRPNSPAVVPSLQDDVLRLILDLVLKDERDPGSMAGMRLLGPQWRRLVSAATTSVAPAALESVAQLCMFPELRALDLRRAAATEGINPAVLEHLPNALRELTSLDCAGWRSLGWGVLAAVAKLRHLQSLSLAHCVELPGVCLAELTPLDRSLLALDLSGCGQLTDADLRCVGELSCLRELRLRGCCQLTDAGIGALAPLDGSLQFLDVGGCPLVDGGSLPGLGSGLTRLDIDKTPLPLRGDGRSALAALTALRRLDAACVFPGSSDEEGQTTLLAGLVGLQHLAAPEAQGLTTAATCRLSTLTTLTAVDLSHAGLTTEGLSAAVAGWHRLRRLNVSRNSALRAAAVEAIAANAPGLTTLDLGCGCSTAVTTAAADAIARCLTRLETLTLPLPPGVSSTAIAALAALPRLRDLDVAHCSRAAGPLLEALAAATKLTRLAIDVHQIGANGLAPLEGLPRLRALRLQLQPLSSPAADPEGYRTAARSLATTLPKLQRLTELALRGTDSTAGPSTTLAVGDALLRHVAGLPRLRRLILDGNASLTERGILAALSRTASLRLLSLVNCGVGGGAAFGARFAAHPYLRVRTRSECQDALSTDAISLGGWLAA